MFGLGPFELVVILVIILVLFGSTQLPKLARSIGASAKELKEGLKEGEKAEASTSEKAEK